MSTKVFPSYAKDAFKKEPDALLELIDKLHDEFKKQCISVDRYESGGILELKYALDTEVIKVIEEYIDIETYNELFVEYSHKPDSGTIDLSMAINDHSNIYGGAFEIVWYENKYDETDSNEGSQYTLRHRKDEWDDIDENIDYVYGDDDYELDDDY